MKLRLAYKIFLIFVTTSLISIVLLVGILSYFIKSDFEDFVNNVELEKYNSLASKLSEAYQKQQDWGFIKRNPGSFHEMVYFDMYKTDGKNVSEYYRLRISLFDAHNKVIAGTPSQPKDSMLKAITVNGKTVGWVGFTKKDRTPTGLEREFLYRERTLFLSVGFAALLIAAFVSYLLSRHILRPVELITQGAHAVASRKFDARIDVRTGDELGQLAEDFNMMAQTLERYENLRKQWISDISHELRTPVSILRGEIEAIQDGLREVTDKNIGSLHAEVMHLQKLINDLHSLAVADNGSLSMKKEKIDIIGLLENSAEKFRPQYSRAGITLEFDKIPGENIFVTTDRDRLSQVFSNIFENTLRYTDSPGEMKIRHEVRHGKIHLYFEDSKPGVPEESFAKLFDRLYRVDTSRSRKRGGSGLGLAICKSIIESSGGEINASGSRLGGLMIEIVMPVLKGE